MDAIRGSNQMFQSLLFIFYKINSLLYNIRLTKRADDVLETIREQNAGDFMKSKEWHQDVTNMHNQIPSIAIKS